MKLKDTMVKSGKALDKLYKEIEELKAKQQYKHIRFKSIPKNWEKEESGRTRSTIREIDWDDERFHIALKHRKEIVILEIENTETEKIFSRIITDTSEYKGFMKISW